MSNRRATGAATSWPVHPAVVYLVAVISFLLASVGVLAVVSWVYPWLVAYGITG